MFDIYVIEKDALTVSRLTGVLDAKTAEKLVDFIEAKEVVTETGSNRFCDLSQVAEIHLSSDDIQQLAVRRRGSTRMISASSPLFLRRIPWPSGSHACTNKC
jgi:hypothetical protein